MFFKIMHDELMIIWLLGIFHYFTLVFFLCLHVFFCWHGTACSHCSFSSPVDGVPVSPIKNEVCVLCVEKLLPHTKAEYAPTPLEVGGARSSLLVTRNFLTDTHGIPLTFSCHSISSHLHHHWRCWSRNNPKCDPSPTCQFVWWIRSIDWLTEW